MTVWVGIDENGLGPRLGPLVVTAIVATSNEEGAKRIPRAPRGAIAKRLGDSKAFVSFGDCLLGEAWARALARKLSLDAGDPDALVHALALEGRDELRAPCPQGHRDQCWSPSIDKFLADAPLVDEIEADLAGLAKKGVQIVGVRSAIVCARRLNDAARRGLSRFHVDLHAMERLVLSLRDAHGPDMQVTCGKVGGFDRYGPAFGPLGGWLHSVVAEGRARSEYAFAGLGRIAFVRDADASHLLVCMASLVGKWVRDMLMGRIVDFYRASDPELPLASGYHDPVTTRFIDGTALVRGRRGIDKACFMRNKLGAEDLAQAPSDDAAAGDENGGVSPGVEATSS